MCGRYFFIEDENSDKCLQILDRAKELNLKDYKKDEVFPGDNCLCLIAKGNGKVDLSIKHWGINKLINGRYETINERKTFKDLKRCVVIASGFFEWKDKEKFIIKTKDEYIYLACLYNVDNDFVILTKDADKYMVNIHDRMPLIMNQKEMVQYLYGEEKLSVKELIIESDDHAIQLFFD